MTGWMAGMKQSRRCFNRKFDVAAIDAAGPNSHISRPFWESKTAKRISVQQKMKCDFQQADKSIPASSFNGLLSRHALLLLLAIDPHCGSGHANCKGKNRIRNAGDDIRGRCHGKYSGCLFCRAMLLIML